MHGLGGSYHGNYGCVTTGLGFGVTLDCGYVLLVVWSGGWSHPGDCGHVIPVAGLREQVHHEDGGCVTQVLVWRMQSPWKLWTCDPRFRIWKEGHHDPRYRVGDMRSL